LSTAIRIADLRPDLSIHILSKNEMKECNTGYAQGGIATVWDKVKDNIDKHIADTLDAGDGLCTEEIVKIVISEGPENVRDLIEWGARFDKDNDGNYDLGKEGGHSENRVLHYKDYTGAEIERALIEKVKSLNNVTIFEHYFAIDLLTQHHLGYNVRRVTPNVHCFGAYVLDKKNLDIETHLAKITIMATGGAGQIYKSTTNPKVATGDGIAMMYRAKGTLENTEFVQFHPTSLFSLEDENPDFLISEAVRGFGAILKTQDGKEFMHKYDERLSLAPRDIVARAIDNEMKIRGEDFVCLDCSHLDLDQFIAHFPTIYDKCKSKGIDITKDMIPVVPASHYFCGGIQVDEMGRSSINHLYAVGECTSSGLHGANRLASNSLLEGLVFAKRIAADVVGVIDGYSINDKIPKWDNRGTMEPKELVLITQSWKELKEIMSTYVGIVRSNVRLKRASDRLWLLYSETERLYMSSKISPQLCELRNLITIGYLVTMASQMRKESRGLHYTIDYPEQQGFIEVNPL